MKLRELCNDWRLMAGVVLIITGAANWGVGFIGTEQSRQPPNVAPQTKAEDVSAIFEGLDDDSNQAVLTPFTQRQRKVSINSAEMDFFHAVFVVGEAIFIVGLVTTLLALLAVLHRDARTAMARALRGRLPAVLNSQRRDGAEQGPGPERG